MGRMQFGMMKLTRIPYRDLQRDIQEAEAMGFDSAWIDDDLFTPSYADFDVWSVLGGLAVATERIRLGTLVTVPTFRLPAVMAAQALTVDHMSNGRIEIGIGAGGAAESYPAIGSEPWTPRERSERLEEFVAIVSHMLRGEPIDYTGQRYAAKVDQVIPPVQQPRPPLTVAAHGPRGMRIAARYADGWNTLVNMEVPGGTEKASKDLADAVANLKRMNEQFDAICLEEGRDPRTVRRSILLDRAQVDPCSSVDAFDEFVGAFQEIGVELIAFYWPPLGNTIPDPTGKSIGPLGRVADIPVSAEQRRVFERVVAERISNRS
jgi:alkanesulfonate monooxygenase SsuD/methylene tetrahydromethanopterin reductase-like flavin-dependent oxidoreductase (luciferase family)